MHRSSTLKILTMLAGTIGAAAPALADTVETRTQLVSTAGLDLHSSTGRATLRHRIQVAARRVCGPDSPVASLNDRSYEKCVTDAAQQASARANVLLAAANSMTTYAAK